jgi:AcrR family transcriptional regulator
MAEMQSRGEIRNNKLQKVAANLFLKQGYDGVTIDRIVEMAGGSKSTVYSEFGGKCGLFIKSIENLCRESNESLTQIDYEGLDLEQSLKKLAFLILKLITSKRSVELHRLAIGEAADCPEVSPTRICGELPKLSLRSSSPRSMDRIVDAHRTQDS